MQSGMHPQAPVGRQTFVAMGGTDVAFDLYDVNKDGVLDATELEVRAAAKARAVVDASRIAGSNDPLTTSKSETQFR